MYQREAYRVLNSYLATSTCFKPQSRLFSTHPYLARNLGKETKHEGFEDHCHLLLPSKEPYSLTTNVVSSSFEARKGSRSFSHTNRKSEADGPEPLSPRLQELRRRVLSNPSSFLDTFQGSRHDYNIIDQRQDKLQMMEVIPIIQKLKARSIYLHDIERVFEHIPLKAIVENKHISQRVQDENSAMRRETLEVLIQLESLIDEPKGWSIWMATLVGLTLVLFF